MTYAGASYQSSNFEVIVKCKSVSSSTIPTPPSYNYPTMTGTPIEIHDAASTFSCLSMSSLCPLSYQVMIGSSTHAYTGSLVYMTGSKLFLDINVAGSETISIKASTPDSFSAQSNSFLAEVLLNCATSNPSMMTVSQLNFEVPQEEQAL